MSTVTINGIDYIPASEGAQHTNSPIRIVILQRGWVMVGRWTQDGEMCALDNAQVIRRWGTTGGLGQLINGPLTDTVLDPAGHVEFHILAVIATISCDKAGWS